MAACIIISSPYVIIASNGMSLNSIDPVEWWGIITPIILSISILIISIVLYLIYSNKQYFVQTDNGKNILIIGSFRKQRRYYLNGSCYVISNDDIKKVSKRKTREDISALFAMFNKKEIVRKVIGKNEEFLIKDKNSEDFFSAGTMPFKYGRMKFIDGKFYKGEFTSSRRRNCVYYKVLKNNVKYNDIVPTCILRLGEKKRKGMQVSDEQNK